jgi:hypothetical protein
VNQACEQKLKRLQEIVEVCHRWDSSIEQVKRMRAWVLAAEHILDGSWAEREEEVTNQQVGQRFDAWYRELQALAQSGMLNDDEQHCLAHFLQVLAHLRPHLIHCYDVAQFPRTNNEMEGYIRAIKTRYRRISGRKNWDAYLLRYGRRVAYYEWWAQEAQRQRKLDQKLRQVDRDCWQQMRTEISCGPSEQLKRYRFRHRQSAFLADLEARWVRAAGT